MWAEDLRVLDRITLPELEATLDKHTREMIRVNQWTAFSWSISRHNLFARCKRQYYLNYYGSRRVREANNKVVSAVWWLKQVTPLKTWIGSVIHHIAQKAVQAHRDGQAVKRDDLVEQASRYYREGVLASERGAKHDGRWIVLQEHVYPGDSFSVDRDEAERQVVDLAHTFYESDAYGFIRNWPPDALREVDEPFQSFELTGAPILDRVQVFAIPDVLLYDGDSIYIIDWKTGEVTGEGIRNQAGIYRLYAHLAYGLPEESIQVSISSLREGGASVEPPGGTPTVKEARTFAYRSIGAMVRLMENVEYNTVSIADFPRADQLELCQDCGFKRVCWRHEGVV